MVTIQSQNFGVEIEMTGVSRRTAAQMPVLCSRMRTVP